MCMKGEIMRDYMIVTDGNCDLSQQFAEEHNIVMIPMGFQMDGKIYGNEDGEDMSQKEFYDKMRGGMMPSTMALNPHQYEQAFRKILEQGKDVLYLAFSSALSSSCESAMLTAKNLMEENDQWTVRVADTLCASMGQGLIVYKVWQQKQQGKTLEEAAVWAEENRLHICHQFTVDDLMHLHRGGRVSKATAVIGTLIHVKPVLHVDDEGHLVSLSNVRGRKKALSKLVENMSQDIGSYKDQNDMIMISHGDCEEDAIYVKNKIKEKLGYDNVEINTICPTIGAHSGPGTVALFFMGEKR